MYIVRPVVSSSNVYVFDLNAFQSTTIFVAEFTNEAAIIVEYAEIFYMYMSSKSKVLVRGANE